jgi:hypothetical protein
MTVEIETPPEGEGEPVEFKDEGPRQHMREVEAENKSLREQVLARHIEAIGLSTTEGLGVAVFDGYKGEFSEEAVAAFAKEKYGHEFVSGEPADEAAEALAAQEEATTAVQQSSAPVVPPTTAGDIADLDSALADPEVDGPAVSKEAIERKLAGYVAGEYRGNPTQI